MEETLQDTYQGSHYGPKLRGQGSKSSYILNLQQEAPPLSARFHHSIA